MLTEKSVCVLQCGDTQCQDVISSVWPRAIFVSVKMGLVPWIQSCTPTWNSTQHKLQWMEEKCGRGGQRHGENMKMRGLVARYHVRDCLWGEARWWGSKVEQCGDMCTRLQGWREQWTQQRTSKTSHHLIKISVKINRITEVITLNVVLIGSLATCITLMHAIHKNAFCLIFFFLSYVCNHFTKFRGAWRTSDV